MGRKFSNDTSPRKIVMSFCLDPDLAHRVKLKCKDEELVLSNLLQTFLTEWTNDEIAFEKETKTKKGKEKHGKPATASKVSA
jgi:hypothetical protein